MILGDLLDLANGLIAAWLQGTEGQGVADVLFGDYKPTGKFSFTWPRSMEQLHTPLFLYGYGLSCSSTGILACVVFCQTAAM